MLILGLLSAVYLILESEENGMTKLKKRLRARQRRQALKNYIKRQLMKLCSIVVIFAMLCSMARLPVAYAYFTAGPKTSEELTFVITKYPGQVEATLEFLDSFLVEEDSPEVQTIAMQSFGNPILPENITSHSTSEILSEQETLKAVITLEEGFNAGDLYIPSIELHYNNQSTPALSGEIDNEGKLIADFDRAKITSWFENSTDSIEDVTFDVTGEGYEEGIYKFIFTGKGTIKLTGVYETRSVEIIGPSALLIPENDQAVTETYQLVNQSGTKRDETTWGLKSPHGGVEINESTGQLIIYKNAGEGNITLTATTEQEGRIHSASKTVAIFHDPKLEITGTRAIKYSDNTVEAQYRLETKNDAKLDNIKWKLAGEVDGVDVDQNGLVTIENTAGSGSFTLVVSATCKGISLTAQTTVEFEYDPPVSIIVPVVNPEDTIQISGEHIILIPQEGELVTFNYSASDLEGNVLEGVSWSLLGDLDGVTLDGNILIVEGSALEGRVTIEAKLARQSGKGKEELLSGTKAITIAFPAPTAINIEGSINIAIPVTGEEDMVVEEAHVYNATVLDQKGNVLEGEEVIWELAEPVEGVYLGEDGELIVTSSAATGIVILLARLVADDEVIGTIEIELVNLGSETPEEVEVADKDVIREEEDEYEDDQETGPGGGGAGGGSDDGDSGEARDPGGEVDEDNNTGEVIDDPALPGDEDDVVLPGDDDEEIDPDQDDEEGNPGEGDDDEEPEDSGLGDQPDEETGKETGATEPGEPADGDLTNPGEDEQIGQPREEDEITENDNEESEEPGAGEEHGESAGSDGESEAVEPGHGGEVTAPGEDTSEGRLNDNDGDASDTADSSSNEPDSDDTSTNEAAKDSQ